MYTYGVPSFLQFCSIHNNTMNLATCLYVIKVPRVRKLKLIAAVCFVHHRICVGVVYAMHVLLCAVKIIIIYEQKFQGILKGEF